MDEEISWTSFLMMLSSEKTVVYWERLNLPIDRKRYSQANFFARGCLELIMYEAIINKREVYRFQESWKDYRTVNPALSDEFMVKTQFIRKNSIDNSHILEIIQLVEKEIDFVEAEKLYNWGISYFRNGFDPILESAKRIKFLVEEEKSGIELKKEENLFEQVKKFCNRVNWRNASLDRHFSVAREVYTMTLPNEFEMVLQDYFNEGARNCYWWAEIVEYNLQYFNFVERWQDLKEEIGSENINLILRWLQETLVILPSQFWQFKIEDLERLKKL
ncbi:MAG: hypothetical protein AAB336_00540 [Acidobacteriota bacterium]